MKIILYVAGMPFDGNTIKEGKSLGGSESQGYYVAKELARRGHEVIVFSNIQEPMQADGVTYMPIGKPTNQFPLGDTFGDYAANVPHDVLIGQRVPNFFSRRYNSKVNLWWTHDLALFRMKGSYESQLPFVDGLLCVSEFHKKQVHEVYGHKKEFMHILPNSIDFDLFKDRIAANQKFESKTLIYSSRPERGLENLVMPGGIMEKLYELDPELKLIVCGYDNTTKQMQGYYNQLWSRCNELPNVENYGPLSKEQLAQLMKGAFLHVYPTEFEETSCITAMEESASGTPFVTTRTGALEETLEDGGVLWVDKDEYDKVDIDKFVRSIRSLQNNQEKWYLLHEKALKKSENFKIEKAIDGLEKTIKEIFESKTKNKRTLVNHLIRNSDIIAANKLISENEEELKDYKEFINKEYKTVFNTDPKDFYDNIADYNTNQIKNNHNLGDDYYQLSMPRIRPVLDFLRTLKKGTRILDYGCCVGQQTIAYARAFPDLEFVGCDIARAQVEIGERYAAENNIRNITFINAIHPSVIDGKFDTVICSEVTEHVEDYNKFLMGLESLTNKNSDIIITVPHGPHEEVRWNQQKIREHLHHFEEEDIKEILEGREYHIVYTSSQSNKYGDILGNFFVHWKSTGDQFGKIDYNRKFRMQAPKETLSACIICRPDGFTLAKTLESVKDIVDEVIIGFDGKEGEGLGWDIAKKYGAKAFEIESPTVQGFDEARNKTIEKAKSDWILWIDDDETFIWPERLSIFLRHNQYDAYAVSQHHFSAEPAGIIKTDFPCRIFRNNKGIKFYGVVHEHPEEIMNETIRETVLIPKDIVAICHNGYENEEIRRGRFLRNWPLMQRDQQKYPDRELGQMLFLRDLIHLNRFELERNGGQITDDMVKRCNMVMNYFNVLIKKKKLRFVIDSLPYITEATKMISNDQGYEVEFCFRINHMDIGDNFKEPPKEFVQAIFPSRSLARKVLDLFVEDKTKQFDHKYM